METIVVTRHKAFADYAVELGLCPADSVVVPHASLEQIRGRKVVTSGLPLHLAAECSSVVTIPLNLPAELRGKELGIEEMRAHAEPATEFKVFDLTNAVGFEYQYERK